jgi:hypothetical protein
VALAVAVVEQGLQPWGWTVAMLSAPAPAPGMGDALWLLRCEWRLAGLTGGVIALLCGPVWWWILRLGWGGYRAACALGAAMTIPFAAGWFHSQDPAQALGYILGMGLAGAAAGAATLGIARALQHG